MPWGVGEEEGGEDAKDHGDGSFDEENEWPVVLSRGLAGSLMFYLPAIVPWSRNL